MRWQPPASSQFCGRRKTPMAGGPATLVGEAVAGLAHIARNPTLRGLAIAYSIYQMSWGVLLVVVPVAVIHALGPTANADGRCTVGCLWPCRRARRSPCGAGSLD